MGRDSRKKPGRTRSWILCAVLALSLWHGPVPWIHSHETLEAQGLSEAALAWHVHHLHPQQSEHAIFGWHIHLSYPWDVSNEPAPPSDPKAPKPGALFNVPCVLTAASASVAVDPHVRFCLPPVASFLQSALTSFELDAARVSGRHFRRMEPPSVSLRALICIARC